MMVFSLVCFHRRQ